MAVAHRGLERAPLLQNVADGEGSAESWALRLLQMMERRIMDACSLWLAWSVPSRAK